MREYFDRLSIDEEGEISSFAHQKMLFLDKNCNLYLSKRSPDVYTVESKGDVLFENEHQDGLSNLLAMALKRVFSSLRVKKKDLVLVVGIGNEGLTADSLGARTLTHLNVSARNKRRAGEGILCALSPSVSGVTGIESFNVIKSVVAFLEPKIVICVDTLATVAPNRLGRIIQLKDGGITPGAGVGNAKNELNKATLGVPVVAIGVPLVIYAKNILSAFVSQSNLLSVDYATVNKTVGDMVVTAKEVDLYVDAYAKVIGKAINRVVHGKN